MNESEVRSVKNMEFKRKLPVPKEIKEQYPLTEELIHIKAVAKVEATQLFVVIGLHYFIADSQSVNLYWSFAYSFHR